LPVGAMAVVEHGQLWLRVAVASQDGRRIERREVRGPIDNGRAMAAALAAECVPSPSGRRPG
jgi:porphobilinogen deaminase